LKTKSQFFFSLG